MTSEAEGNSTAQGVPWGHNISVEKGPPLFFLCLPSPVLGLPAKREGLAKQLEVSSLPVS